MTSPRLFFYCNAMSDALRLERGIVTDSPAATRKVVAICRALRAAGVSATIISMGRGGGVRSGRLFRARVGRLHGVPALVGPTWHVPVVSQLLSAFWLASAACRLESRHGGAVHLFYNQLTAYLPALAALRVLQARTAVDIEDGPIKAQRSAYSRRLSTVPPSFFGKFVSGGALLATSALADGTPIRPVLPCYGAVPDRGETPRKSPSHSPLIALYAGYLNEDTGVNLLISAIEVMRQSDDPVYQGLVIEVTGMGPGIQTLQALDEQGAPRLRVHGRLETSDYERLLNRAHLGLSLKLVGGNLSESTFPSKTVEYAEHGLALIATDISDVRRLFGQAALYIERDDPAELVSQLRRALLDRGAMEDLAHRGRGIVRDRLSYAAAGRMITNFFWPNAT